MDTVWIDTTMIGLPVVYKTVVTGISYSVLEDCNTVVYVYRHHTVESTITGIRDCHHTGILLVWICMDAVKTACRLYDTSLLPV
jgi:hypothetical protein